MTAATVAARALAGLSVAALLVGCGLVPAHPQADSSGAASPGPASSAPPPHLSVAQLTDPAAGKYFGIEANGAPYVLGTVRTIAASVGEKPNLIGQYVAWKTPFDASAVANAWSYGALSYLAWEPFNTSVQAIADGSSDAYIRRFAEAVRALKLPIALSFGHEMNGNWYPWGTTGTTPATFVAAWRHIHDLFRQAGATNVIWVWNPNIINPMPQVQLQAYWPGAAYVDWVGLTGYFATTGPHSYADVYGPTIAEVRKFSTKPFIVAETAVETGPSQVHCIDSLIRGIEHHSDMLGFIWFDYDKAGVDWRIESRPDVRAALAGQLGGLQLVNPAR